jgi:hypothetical protein
MEQIIRTCACSVAELTKFNSGGQARERAGELPHWLAQLMLCVSPCRVHWLDQPSGVTFTTVRRPHRAQYRGGSSSLAARQAW